MNAPAPRLIAMTVAVLTLLWLSCVPDQVMIERNADPVCGDGQVQGTEQCDDGNTADGDGCSSICVTEPTVETACDDSVDNDLDGLVDCADNDCASAAVCTAVCGDRVIDPGEECDDGNSIDGDGCTAACEMEAGPETICDDRADNDGDGLVDCMDPDCLNVAFCLCGNGVVEGLEECDDGNNTDGDGCSSSCLDENQPMCGNGIIEAGEGCDDGNSNWCDGCDPSCQLQPATESDCSDSIDEDCDGNIDCADSDCAGAPGCP